MTNIIKSSLCTLLMNLKPVLRKWNWLPKFKCTLTIWATKTWSIKTWPRTVLWFYLIFLKRVTLVSDSKVKCYNTFLHLVSKDESFQLESNFKETATVISLGGEKTSQVCYVIPITLGTQAEAGGSKFKASLTGAKHHLKEERKQETYVNLTNLFQNKAYNFMYWVITDTWKLTLSVWAVSRVEPSAAMGLSYLSSRKEHSSPRAASSFGLIAARFFFIY